MQYIPSSKKQALTSEFSTARRAVDALDDVQRP